MAKRNGLKSKHLQKMAPKRGRSLNLVVQFQLKKCQAKASSDPEYTEEGPGIDGHFSTVSSFQSKDATGPVAVLAEFSEMSTPLRMYLVPFGSFFTCT